VEYGAFLLAQGNVKYWWTQ